MPRRKKDVIDVIWIDGGTLPPYLGPIHRHFEKAIPATVGPRVSLNAPLDLLENFIPPDVFKEIESFEVIYKKDS